MARSRNIKPGFFQNDMLAEKPPLTRILFAALWPIADRDGRLEDRPKKLKALCLPFDECDVDAALSDLASGDDPFLIRYEVDGRRFIQIVNWHKHQAPHVREPASSIPAVPDMHVHCTGSAPATPVLDTDQDTAEPVGSGMRVKGIRNQESGKGGGAGEPNGKQFKPPTVDEVRAYCAERENRVEAQQFVDFYTSKGWKVGNQAMKDWQAAVRTWETHSRNRGAPAATGPTPRSRSGAPIIPMK